MVPIIATSTITIPALTSGAAPVVLSFFPVIMVTLGIGLGIFGIGFIISMVGRTLATVPGAGSSQRSTGFGKH
jgi:hypothetical protein